jgi:hypothetical protein
VDSLKLWDINDRELLHIVNEERMDSGDHAGWTFNGDIAERLGVQRRSVGPRVAWMVRYGVMEKHAERPGMYRLTRIGHSLKDGELSEAQAEAVKGAEPDQVLMLTRALTQRYRRVGESARHLTRREWIVGTTKPKE